MCSRPSCHSIVPGPSKSSVSRQEPPTQNPVEHRLTPEQSKRTLGFGSAQLKGHPSLHLSALQAFRATGVAHDHDRK